MKRGDPLQDNGRLSTLPFFCVQVVRPGHQDVTPRRPTNFALKFPLCWRAHYRARRRKLFARPPGTTRAVNFVSRPFWSHVIQRLHSNYLPNLPSPLPTFHVCSIPVTPLCHRVHVLCDPDALNCSCHLVIKSWSISPFFLRLTDTHSPHERQCMCV